MINIDYPFHLDGKRAALTNDADHIRDMIEEFLFTNPGERVNRPDFGAGLLQRIFEPNSDELATAVQFLIQSGLQQWLADVIEVGGVEVVADDATLQILVPYVIRQTGEAAVATFTRGSGSVAW